MSHPNYQPGDTIAIYDSETRARFDVLVTDVAPTYVEGPYSSRGNTFEYGRFHFAAYVFPHEKPDPIDVLRRLIEQRGQVEDMSNEERETWKEAEALVVKHDANAMVAAS